MPIWDGHAHVGSSMDPAFLVKLMEQYGIELAIVSILSTAPDEFCNPSLMLELARKHPRVKIVMIHMSLGDKDSDNEAAIEAAKQASNLYLDTSWVPSQKVIEAVREVGQDRVLFGTDAPLGSYFKTGDYEHYDHYFLFDAIPRQPPPFIQTLQKELSPPEYEHVMYLNARRLYKL